MIFGSMLGIGTGVFITLSKIVANFKRYGKAPFLYMMGMSLLTGASLFLISYLTENYFNIYILFLLIFLLMGIIHTVVMLKNFWSKKNENTLLSEILFIISIILFSCVVFAVMEYFITAKNFMYYPMLLSALGFVIPTFVYYTFEKSISLPEREYIKWYYPINAPLPEPDDDDMRDLIVIGFEMEKTLNDTSRTYFRARAPIRMDLSTLFYHFINDYNDTHSETQIELTNDYGEPFGWIFYKKVKWYQRETVFDPQAPILVNGIKENTVIICKRFIENNNEE